MQLRDPRTDIGQLSTGSPTGVQHQGGYADAAGVDLGNGTAAILTIAATRTKTTPAASSTSVQLLAADSSRVAATIVNTDTAKKLYLGLNGAPGGVNAPAAPTLTPGGSGGPGARTEYFKVTLVDQYGETVGSAEANTALSAGQLTTVTSPAATAGATGYRVYGAISTGAEVLQTPTPINIGTPWVEPTGGLVTGTAPPPASSTAMSNIVVPPLGAYSAQASGVAGQINGVWEPGATGPANVTATTA